MGNGNGPAYGCGPWSNAAEGYSMQRTGLFALVAACVLWSAAAPAQQTSPTYRITVLPPLPKQQGSAGAFSINDDGTVAGSAKVIVAGKGFARWTVFRWTAEDGTTPMPAGRDGEYPAGLGGVDGSGRVFGTALKPKTGNRAVIWGADGEVSAVARGVAGIGTQAFAVNADGDAVGVRDDPAQRIPTRAMFWPRIGAAIDITADSNVDMYLYPYGVNTHGVVVGEAYPFPPATGSQGFVWSAAEGLRLTGRLPGGVESGRILLVGINDAGVAAGYGQLATGMSFQAFRWTAERGFELLDTAGSCDATYAHGINNSGWIIGYCIGPRNDGFLWTPDDGPRWLQDLVASDDPLKDDLLSIYPMAINAQGTITCACYRRWKGEAMILTPVEAAPRADRTPSGDRRD